MCLTKNVDIKVADSYIILLYVDTLIVDMLITASDKVYEHSSGILRFLKDTEVS